MVVRESEPVTDLSLICVHDELRTSLFRRDELIDKDLKWNQNISKSLSPAWWLTKTIIVQLPTFFLACLCIHLSITTLRPSGLRASAREYFAV